MIIVDVERMAKAYQGFCHYKIAEVCTSTHFAVEWSKFIVVQLDDSYAKPSLA